MKAILFFGIIFFTIISCKSQVENGTISSVNKISEVDFLNENNVLLDVRTPEEFQKGNIPNSINLDYNSSEFDSLIKNLDPNKTYYVYCKSGNRSTKAVVKMKEFGFKNTINLKDGYSAYKE